MRKQIIKKITVYILILSLALITTGCASPKSVQTSKGLTAKDLIEPVAAHDTYVKAFYGDIMNVDVLNGRVSPDVKYLSFDKSVTFGEYCADRGDKVKKGDVLARSYTAGTEGMLKDLKKQLQDLKDKFNYDNSTKEYQLSILKDQLSMIDKSKNRDEYVSKQAEIDKSQLLISQSNDLEKLEENHLKDQISDLTGSNAVYEVKAPYDGYIVSLMNVKQGDIISTAGKVIGFADTTKAVVQTNFIEPSVASQYVRMFMMINGKEYKIKYTPYSDTDYKSITAAGDTPIGNFSFTNNTNDTLIGSFATVVLVREEKKHVLCIPNESINQDNSGQYIFKIENNKKVRYDIKTGISDGVYTEILDGVKEGDNVFTWDNNKDATFSKDAVKKGDFSKEYKTGGEKVWLNEKPITLDTEGTNVVFNSFAVRERNKIKAGQTIAYVVSSADDVTLVEKKFELNALKKKISGIDVSYNASMRLKKNELNNLKSTFERNIKNTEIKLLKLDYDYQKSELDKQRQILEQEVSKISAMSKVSKIVAKEDCVITGLGHLSKGDIIQPTTIIAKTAKINDFYIAITDDQCPLNYGQKVKVVDDSKSKTDGMVITTWNDSLPTQLKNPGVLIKVNDFTKVNHNFMTTIAQTNIAKNVIMIDNSYVFTTERCSYVKYKDKDGKIVRKVFIPGGSDEKYCWAVTDIPEGLELMKNTEK